MLDCLSDVRLMFSQASERVDDQVQVSVSPSVARRSFLQYCALPAAATCALGVGVGVAHAVTSAARGIARMRALFMASFSWVRSGATCVLRRGRTKVPARPCD